MSNLFSVDVFCLKLQAIDILGVILAWLAGEVDVSVKFYCFGSSPSLSRFNQSVATGP